MNIANAPLHSSRWHHQHWSLTESSMRLYYHKTDGGAEYLFDTFIDCENGQKEGVLTDRTKYVIRIDGNIEEDAELSARTLCG